MLYRVLHMLQCRSLAACKHYETTQPSTEAYTTSNSGCCHKCGLLPVACVCFGNPQKQEQEQQQQQQQQQQPQELRNRILLLWLLLLLLMGLSGAAQPFTSSAPRS
jgi:malate synthase